MDHSINLTHDGTLILRIPKGYQVDKVVVEEMGTENRKEYQPTRPTSSNTLGALDCVERQAAIDAARDWYEGLICGSFKGLEKRLRALPPAQPETAKRIVGKSRDGMTLWYQCDMCNEPVDVQDNYCHGCGRRLIDE